MSIGKIGIKIILDINFLPCILSSCLIKKENGMFKKNDGGRSKYFKGYAGDCVTRAIAINMNKDYLETYGIVADYNKGKRKGGRSARNGVTNTGTFNILASLGYKYKKRRMCSKITLTEPFIADIRHHLVSVTPIKNNDGEYEYCFEDTWDSSTKYVKGYWIKE